MGSDRRLLTGSVMTAAGAAQLTASYLLTGWASGVLVNTGTATLLFVPLYLVQRRMEQRVEATSNSVQELGREVHSTQAEVRQSIEDLRRTFSDTDQDALRAREADVAALAAHPSCVGVRRVLVDAVEERVVSPRGVRVHVVDPTVFVYARLRPADDGASVDVALEKRDGEVIERVVWHPLESPAELMSHVAASLRRESLHPGEGFDPALLFRDLQATIREARRIKERFTLVDDMACAQEFVPPQWFIYDWGIGAGHDGLQPYYIDLPRLVRDRDLVPHMLEKTWLDEDSFRQALTTAQALHAGGNLPID